ncbi:MAG: TonB-dependent receptor [Flavobacteriales bacterium]|nr:TonB-dependent receptor [Flavobacteriales bacterium]
MSSKKTITSPKNKALEVNLNTNIYGSFSEIGAGQETVRFFFRAGGASQTIAKAMSAYDKEFSDAIYGKEEDGRYVTEPRLVKMLKHEVSLMEQRLERSVHAGKLFFSYANTVQTIDFAKKNKGHGWVGIRFQLDEMEDYNEIILHLKFHENDARLQQETLGILGVNLIYGAFYYGDNPRLLIESLYDEIAKDQLEIDMINFNGPRFAYVDNRLMSLQLVRNGMTNSVVFNPNGRNVLSSEILYKKNIFAMRGSFRPVTNVNMDMLKSGMRMFLEEDGVTEENTRIIFEITLSNLTALGEINERDFLDRADILGKLGYTVMISNYSEYYRLVNYFSKITNKRIGIILGVNNLLNIFNEEYYVNLSGGIMEAFGKLFINNVRLYLYPYIDQETNELLTSENLKVAPELKELYKYFKNNGWIKDVDGINEENLHIYSRDVLTQICMGEEGWESKVPEGVSKMIKDRVMFGYNKGFKLH